VIGEDKSKQKRYNVYTNPITNPQRNPNVDSKRTTPLTNEEISAIIYAHKYEYPEMGPWNLSLILSNVKSVHVSTMSIYRVLYPEKYRPPDIPEEDEIRFYEKHRPHAMYHTDTMEVILASGGKIYQISIEDDHSRGYMAFCVFPKKHSYFVVLTMLRAFKLYSKSKLFHHDNGSEFNNGIISRLLEMLGITDVPTEVENPKGNGKKENGHKQDRKYFYEKHQFQDIKSVKQKIPEYLKLHNEIKGQWARYGQTAVSILEGAEANPLTDEELEKVIRELYFMEAERMVKQNGKVKFEGKWYHLTKRMSGKTVEVRITLRGLEIWFKGVFVKRWKYWKYVLGIDVDHILKEYVGYVL